MSSALVLDRVTASYAGGRVIALQDFSLTVAPGEVFALRGNNGAGKSTVLKILAGLLRPAAGSARIFDVDVSVAEARRGVGFVPEMPALPPQLTPLEILETGLSIHQGSLPNARQHCLDWLDKLGLRAVTERRVGGFSKGMLQRVSLAHALAIRPKLLVLDEPLSGLDAQARQQIVDLLLEFKQAGGSMLLISHVADDVERLADRDGILIEGKWQPAKSPPA